MARPKRILYVNQTEGHIGVTKIDARGNEKGIALEPGQRIHLTAEEVAITDAASVDPAMSPFKPQEYVKYDPITGEELERGTRAPLVPVNPAQGAFQPGEEVAA